MRRFTRSLSFRISVFNSLLIFCFAGIQYLLVVSLFKQGTSEIEQRLSWEIAQEIAHELRPVFEPNVDDETLRAALSRILRLNPKIDIAILDLDGNILYAAFARGHNVTKPKLGSAKIDVEVIDKFLTIDPRRAAPIYGTKLPTDIGRARRVFTATKIRFGTEPAYLYVVLESSGETLFQVALETLYVIRGGFLTAVLLVILAIGLGTLVMYRITARFRRMTATVEKVANGSLDLRVDEQGNDEVSSLGRSINTMANSIISSMRKATEADQQRKEMIATLSHDLGAPLAAIQSHAELLLDAEHQDKRDQNAALQVIHRNAEALTRLIRDLLQLSKIEAMELKPTLEPITIAELISEELLPKYALLAKEREVEICSDFADDGALVLADYSLLSRILSNLIENAIRYNRPSGTVTIQLRAEGPELLVVIEDTGIGIPPEDAARVFDKFFRADPARRKSTGGTGLGLWIVKSLLVAHGSTIELRPRDGGGSVFSFRLPIVTVSQENAVET